MSRPVPDPRLGAAAVLVALSLLALGRAGHTWLSEQGSVVDSAAGHAAGVEAAVGDAATHAGTSGVDARPPVTGVHPGPPAPGVAGGVGGSSGPGTVAEPAPPGRAALAALREGRGLDLNRAGPAELRLLPGIGPALSARIIAYRQRHGAFANVEALDAVSGIGPRTLERLRPLLRVEASAPAAETPQAAEVP